MTGVLWQVFDFARHAGFSHLLISAIATRLGMYRKLGFQPLGPAVTDGDACFLPMVMSLADQMRSNRSRVERHQRRWRTRQREAVPISLLPGPVEIAPQIEAAFHVSPVSHRCAAFVRQFAGVRTRLESLMADLPVAVFPGAGTLANDLVAANLKAIFAKEHGLILTNGEFGERLTRQATAAGLTFEELGFGWGSPWHLPSLHQALARRPAWVWAVHLETSTGILNPIDQLLKLAAGYGTRVALDCVSSLGAVPISDPTGSLIMASGVSGKSLGSYAGLAFVALGDAGRRKLAGKFLPPSFDLVRMLDARSPVTTVPSPLLAALACTLDRSYSTASDASAHFRHSTHLGLLVRQGLRSLGIEPLSREAHAAPNITTFKSPWPSFVTDCLRLGFQIAHESGYLVERGWCQIATMGNVDEATVSRLFESLLQTSQPRGAALAVAL